MYQLLALARLQKCRGRRTAAAADLDFPVRKNGVLMPSLPPSHCNNSARDLGRQVWARGASIGGLEALYLPPRHGALTLTREDTPWTLADHSARSASHDLHPAQH